MRRFTPPRACGSARTLRKSTLGGTGNGKTLREPYLFESGPYFTPPAEVTVPEGRLFLLGDHRVAAADSRAHLYENSGTIARSAVVGMAVDRASVPSPDRLWMWVGAATAAAGLVEIGRAHV